MRDPVGLHVDELYAGFGRDTVLEGVSASFAPGTTTAIVGPNGCGKSTALRVMARLHRPSSGRVRVGDHNLWALPPRRAARLIGLLPQDLLAPEGITVFGLVRFGRHPHQSALRRWSKEDERAVSEALALTRLDALADRRLGELSGGQRQRAWIAMTLAQATPVLLLDEPTSALDLGHQIEVLELIGRIASEGRTVVMVVHDLGAAARHADRMLALLDGRTVASGTPADMLTEDLVRLLYGVDAQVVAGDDGAPAVVPRRGVRLKPASGS